MFKSIFPEESTLFRLEKNRTKYGLMSWNRTTSHPQNAPTTQLLCKKHSMLIVPAELFCLVFFNQSCLQQLLYLYI